MTARLPTAHLDGTPKLLQKAWYHPLDDTKTLVDLCLDLLDLRCLLEHRGSQRTTAQRDEVSHNMGNHAGLGCLKAHPGVCFAHPQGADRNTAERRGRSASIAPGTPASRHMHPGTRAALKAYRRNTTNYMQECGCVTSEAAQEKAAEPWHTLLGTWLVKHSRPGRRTVDRSAKCRVLRPSYTGGRDLPLHHRWDSTSPVRRAAKPCTRLMQVLRWLRQFSVFCRTTLLRPDR